MIASNVVHGFAYAFFFATVYIFVDENFPKDVRDERPEPVQPPDPGPGALPGQLPLGWLGDYYKDPVTKEVDFGHLFLYPLGVGLFAAALLALFFHPQGRRARPGGARDCRRGLTGNVSYLPIKPFDFRNSSATSAGSRCWPSTWWFNFRIVSASSWPASALSAGRSSLWRRSVSDRASGTAS